MVLILYGQCYITVSIYSVVTIGACRRISYETEISCISTLLLNFVTNCFQLVFRCCTTGCNRRIFNAPRLIIKTGYIVAVIRRICPISLFTHGYGAGFHSIRSNNRFNIEIFLQFKTDLSVITGLSNFRRNVVIAVYRYLGA